MDIVTMIGNHGQKVIMEYNCDLSVDSKIDFLKILINQCWKILPIYEGKDINSEITYSREEAYSGYQKHLNFLITKLIGANKIWGNDQYFVELLCILIGMRDMDNNSHDKVRYFVHHCTKLLNKMLNEVQK